MDRLKRKNSVSGVGFSRGRALTQHFRTLRSFERPGVLSVTWDGDRSCPTESLGELNENAQEAPHGPRVSAQKMLACQLATCIYN